LVAARWRPTISHSVNMSQILDPFESEEGGDITKAPPAYKSTAICLVRLGSPPLLAPVVVGMIPGQASAGETETPRFKGRVT
jgi:hypothetical protein